MTDITVQSLSHLPHIVLSKMGGSWVVADDVSYEEAHRLAVTVMHERDVEEVIVAVRVRRVTRFDADNQGDLFP